MIPPCYFCTFINYTFIQLDCLQAFLEPEILPDVVCDWRTVDEPDYKHQGTQVTPDESVLINDKSVEAV